ncbi:BMP family ABC transporter substrate-binding protein [Mycoplasmatota bacterium zrk1]
MKRILSLLVGIAVVITLTACGPETYTVAMITDSTDDELFEQGTWKGIETYCEEFGLTYNYYIPLEISEDASLDTIESAIDSGAEVVVATGFLFETAIYEAQFKYPDVTFILVDGQPHTLDHTTYETADNTLAIVFNEHESGFLAGYAAVKDGYTNLGFTGSKALPTVIRFGVGFIAGAYYASEEDNMALNFSNGTYDYFDNYETSDDYRNLAAHWYVTGTQIIFAVTGEDTKSVIETAEEYSTKVIGAGIDQSYLSSTVITSALKNLSTAVYQALADWEDGTFAGGTVQTKGVENNCVGLSMDSSDFKNFTQEEYELIYSKIVNGKIEIPESYEELVIFFSNEGIFASGYPSMDVVQP